MGLKKALEAKHLRSRHEWVCRSINQELVANWSYFLPKNPDYN